jgi:RecB family endonuclease NucS
MCIDTVKAILSQYRALQGEYDMRTALLPGSELDEAALILNRKIAVIEAWLKLLTEEERFVIIKHFIDQRPWPLLLVEYEKQWGASQARHMRTLKRFQAKALEKMAAGVEKWKIASEIQKLFNL